MRGTLFLIILWISHFASAQTLGEWTWMGGDSTANNNGVFGIQGVPDANNKPPGLYQSCSWTDADGNFWLFGGANYTSGGGFRPYNTLWKYIVATNEWTWVKGANGAYSAGFYGTQGIPDVNNNPGARYMAASWADTAGQLWLFGGYGFDDGDFGIGILNDLWKYDPSTNTWTWMKGSNSAFQLAVYGQKGIADSLNTPGGKAQANSWTDHDGNLWLFGGFLHYSLTYDNDLWRYNPTTNEWTWMKGDSLPGQLGSFGTLGIASSTNNPSARTCQAHWVDTDGNLWLFGGYKLFYISGYYYAAGDDLWEYLTNENNWVCWRSSFSGDIQTNNGMQCLTDTMNYPKMREQTSMIWKDVEDNFWLFGGHTAESLFDLWKYFPDKNIWVREFGIADFTGGYFNEKGISSPLNIPPSRYGGISWRDTWGNFWLFGGIYDYDFNDQTDCFNDLWRYVPDTACGVFTLTTEIEIERNKFEIYPNPTTGRFTIEFNESQLGEEAVVVELRALVGNMLEQHHLQSTNGYLKRELDLQQPAGIYLITVCSKNDCITQKLMIAQ